MLDSSALEMSDSAVQNNQAKDIGDFDGKPQTCGAICASDLCKITIFNSSFVSNKGPVVYICDGVSLRIDHCDFSKNLELTLRVTSSYIYSTDSFFNQNSQGTLIARKSSNTSFCNCSFTNNSDLGGSAIHTTDSNVRLIGCNFTSNRADAMGGALFIESGTLLVIDCIMNNHSAKENGGVGLFSNSQINITTSIFNSNFGAESAGSTGVFRIENSTVNVWNSAFAENIGGKGGVINARDSSVINISNTIFVRNIVDRGAVLYAENGVKVYVSNSKLNQNHAAIGGAGYFYGAILEINLSQVESNIATMASAGAFIAIQNSLLILKYSLIKGNKGIDTGSLHMYNSTGYLEHCTFLGNRGKYTGAITVLRSELRLSNVVLLQNMAQNDSTDIFDVTTIPSDPSVFINRIYTYKSLMKHGTKILNSNITNFKQIAIEDHFLQERPMKSSVIEETQFASSKPILILFNTIWSFLVSIIVLPSHLSHNIKSVFYCQFYYSHASTTVPATVHPGIESTYSTVDTRA